MCCLSLTGILLLKVCLTFLACVTSKFSWLLLKADTLVMLLVSFSWKKKLLKSSLTFSTQHYCHQSNTMCPDKWAQPRWSTEKYRDITPGEPRKAPTTVDFLYPERRGTYQAWPTLISDKWCTHRGPFPFTWRGFCAVLTLVNGKKVFTWHYHL